MNPTVKWSGSKRSQSEMIVSHFPKQIETYYEPFCGGASVFCRLEQSETRTVNGGFVLTDVNQDLIALYKAIQKCPAELCEHYELLAICHKWLKNCE